MSSKVKRKVTVENSKEGDDQPRRPSVFERLGPNAVNVAAQPSDRYNRTEQNDKCRNWLSSGSCIYGNTCRFKHDPYPQSSRRASKPEKDMDEKDLRHRVRTKRDDPKASRTGSLSPKRVGKRNNSRSRKGDHESKIKSTVVVTRPRSPAPASGEPPESKKKSDGNWEDDSDDWPMDAAQLDFKEELTLERKRQQLQRELALELQKERLLNENVTITKTVSFSESSSSSSSSDSGSISSSSESSSSSSDDDTDSSSSSSSSSSSGSCAPVKKRSKKSTKDVAKSGKVKDDYDKIKSSRAKMQKMRSPSPLTEGRMSKKKDKRKESSVSPRRRLQDSRHLGDARSLNVRVKGPRTPSPVTTSKKQRQWAQSSSTDSRSADVQRNRGKRHKKKKDGSKSNKFISDRASPPPPLSSPNRTALIPSMSSKKSKQRDELGSKSRYRAREPSPILSRNSASNSSTAKLLGNSQRYVSEEKLLDKHRIDDRSKFYSKKDADDMLEIHKRTDSRDRNIKRSRISPRKDNRRVSLSPLKDRYDSEMMPGMKKLYPQISHKEDKVDHRRQASGSPVRGDRRKILSDVDKKRDVRELSPRMHESRRDNQYRNTDIHFDKRTDQKGKRILSPEPKKSRDDRNRDYNQKDRNADYETGSWSTEHRKTCSTGRRTPEPRGRQELRSQPSSSLSDRSRERDLDRKKRKERDLSARSEGSDRNRLPSPRRSQSPPILGHHAVREIEPLTGNRGRLYDTDVPPGEHEYAYGYDSLHDPYLNDRLLPSDYETDPIRSSSLYPDVYPESRYRRDGKESATLIDRYGGRDVLSPHEILPRDIISLTSRSDDYITDMPVEERGYEERWPRGRGRDDWDSYGTIPPAPLPPHVAAALDEDRYGMPRRRRASPEWPRGRLDDRDSSLGVHRQLGRGQLSQDGRSRSPPSKKPAGNRAAWGDRGARHDTRIENRLEDAPKVLDDRKNRNIRKDRIKRKDDLESKPVIIPKEKAVKRQHSPSPTPKDVKRRREDTSTPENVISQKAVAYKRLNQELKGDKKPVNRLLKKVKKGSGLSIRELTKYTASPRSENSSPQVPEKPDPSKLAEVKAKEEKKPKHDSTRKEDDFSDWSDGDDDLLNRDDFVDSEGTNDNSRVRHRSGDKMQDDSALKRKDKPVKEQPQVKRIKESRSRTTSRDRSTDDTSLLKDSKLSVDGKETEVHETSSLKDDAATDVDEYITAESVDYDPISDDELDALIEEPEESLLKPQLEKEKSKIVDALDVDWSALMKDTKTEFKRSARKRFTPAHVISRIGFSQVFAGPELSEKVIKKCQEQLDAENDENNGEKLNQPKKSEEKKFVMEHQIAAFHVAISQIKKERIEVFSQVGPYRRALCARRDLQIRNLLCKPLNKLTPTAAVSYSPHYSIGDKDLYKQSLEFLKKKSPSEIQPKTVDVSAC